MAERLNLLLAAKEPKIIRQIHEEMALSSLKPNKIINADSLEKVVNYPDKPDIDVLLIDVEYALPDLNKTFQTIQDQFPNLPIVVLVDIKDFEIARQAVTRGAHGFVIKTELISSVLECVILQAVNLMKTRTQLGESTRQIKNLMDNLPGIAYRCKNDENWTMEFISAGCRQLTGYDAEDLQFNKNISFNNLIDPDDRQRVWGEIQKAIKENRQYRLEYRIHTADNQEKWVWEQGNLADSDHGIQMLEGFITDISDRHQRELNMRSLIEISDLIRESFFDTGLGDKILEKIAFLYENASSAIAIISNHSDFIKMNYAQGEWVVLKNKELSIKGTKCQEAIQKVEPIFVDSQFNSGFVCEPLKNKNCRYIAFFPLVIEDKVIGLLMAGRNVQYSRNDIQVFTAISDLVSSALERQQLIQRLERQLERVESLHTIDQAITGIFDISVINRVILEEVRKRLGADAANILHLNSLNNTLDLYGAIGLRSSFIKTVKVPISTSIAGKVLMDRSVFEVPDLSNNPVEFLVREWQDEGFKAYFAHPLIVKGKPVGVMEVFFKRTFYPDQEWLRFFESLATQAAVAYDSYHTFSDLQKIKQNLANTYNAALETWSKSLELNNIESHGHIKRVTSQTLQLAKELGVDENELPNIERGALLHDIGKLGILDEILLKKGKLTDTEWHEIEKHPTIARDLLSGVNLLKDAIEIPFSHHENWDGSGYPQGLKGEAIPKAARIFTVVETYDALMSDKPYRKSWTKEKTIDFLIEEKGKKFDPEIVDTFLKNMK